MRCALPPRSVNADTNRWDLWTRWEHLGELDRLYVQTLHHGLMLLKNTLRVRGPDWSYALADFLHNIPSLIGETNAHRYFWDAERTFFIERVNSLDSDEANSEVRIHFGPIWEAMGPLIPWPDQTADSPPTAGPISN